MVADTDRHVDKEVLPNLEAVGWYALGKQPTSQHIAIHTELSQLMESPLLLLFDPQGLDEDAGRVQKTLPVTVYESVEPTTSETGAAQLREVKWMLATSETERIAVDHVGKTGQASTRNMLQEVIVRYANDEIGAAALGQSSLESAGTEEEDSADLRDAALVAHHKQQINAVQILQARIELILRFVASVQSGTIATTPETQALVARVGVLVDALSSIQAQGSSAGATQAGNSQLDADRQATTQLDQLLTLLTSTRQLTTLIEDFGNAQRDDKASKRRQPQERREFRRAPGHGYPVEIGPGA